MSRNIQRKPRPSPPNWYWIDTDNCWPCKNRNNCSNCKFLKIFKASQKKSERRKQKQKLKKTIDF